MPLIYGSAKTGLFSSGARSPLVTHFNLPLGNQEIKFLKQTYMLGALNSKGFGILGVQLLFLEHSLEKMLVHETKKLKKIKENKMMYLISARKGTQHSNKFLNFSVTNLDGAKPDE